MERGLLNPQRRTSPVEENRSPNASHIRNQDEQRMIQVTLDVGTLFSARQSAGSDTADHAGRITQNSRICAPQSATAADRAVVHIGGYSCTGEIRADHTACSGPGAAALLDRRLCVRRRDRVLMAVVSAGGPGRASNRR